MQARLHELEAADELKGAGVVAVLAASGDGPARVHLELQVGRLPERFVLLPPVCFVLLALRKASCSSRTPFFLFFFVFLVRTPQSMPLQVTSQPHAPHDSLLTVALFFVCSQELWLLGLTDTAVTTPGSRLGVVGAARTRRAPVVVMSADAVREKKKKKKG